MKRNLPSVIAALLSIVLVVAGAVMIWQGQVAKGQIRDALVAENVVTPEDADIPSVPVDSAATAKAQADIIQKHALNITGGKTYAELDREDPLRATYLSAVTLRTSLMLAYTGFKIADLVTGIGALFLVAGLGGGLASGVALRQTQAVATGIVREQRVTTSV